MKKNTRDKIVKSVCALLGAAAVLLLWQYASENFFERIGVIPSPLKTLETIVGEAAKANFFTAIKNTLWTSVLSFLAAAVPAFVLAAAAHMFPPLKHFLNPFITIARAVPTMAAVIILLLFLGSKQLPIAVGFLVVFPLVYENIYTAFSKVDRELVEMAKSFRVKKGRQITGIYLPAILPYIFSATVAGFGLNIKVVIAAEVMGLPNVSIGYYIMTAQQGMDFTRSFAWLVIAVVLSFVCERILKWFARICMPHLRKGKVEN